MASAALPSKPHQPRSCDYPKRSFGTSKPVLRSFQPDWFSKWPFLHYNEAKDLVFCHTCLLAFDQKKIKAANADPAFVTRGYSNWKNATLGFKKHELSGCHKEAVEVMITIPATTPHIGEMLSSQLAISKDKNREALHQIFTSIKYLCRQGLAIRGDGCEKDGNFTQLLLMKAELDPNLQQWMKRKGNSYTSPDIQNEVIKIMGVKLLRSIATDLQSSPFLTVMVDETRDISNKEQATVIIRWIKDFEVFEEFLGLYFLPSIDSDTIVSMVKDVLIRMNLSISKLRGQCYDGASAMKGHRNGVAKQMSEIEPRAVFTHCYGHSLNLAASDTLRESKLMRDALDTVHEITKLIKYSPKREHAFQSIKEGAHGPGIRVLCPTRWTVKGDSIASVLKNYEVLQSTWQEASSFTNDSEMKARICGVSVSMETFNFIFGAMLGEMILSHADNLSSTLQHQSMSAAGGQEIARMTVQTLESIRNDSSFDLFWIKVSQFVSLHHANEPHLPRQRKTPRRYEEGTSGGDFHDTPKDYYRQHYFEAIDMLVNCIQERFNQPGYKVYATLESLLVKACKKEDFEEELKFVCEFYKDDLNECLLRVQLPIFVLHFQELENKLDKISIFDLKKYFSSISDSQAALIEEVKKIMQIILIMPATNATSERSFSALRRVKTYLRSTMCQERLNHLMLLHVHKDYTDNLCIKAAINEFIDNSANRSTVFSKYKI